MPVKVIVLLSIIGALNTTSEGVRNTVTVFKAIHHHSTKPVYAHVLKPTGKAIKQTVEATK